MTGGSDAGNDPTREYERRRDRLVRQATLYSVGFFLGAVIVALVGSAIIAWALSRFGLPFRTTWLVVAASVIIVPLGIHLYTIVRRRRRPDGSEGADVETEARRGEREEARDDGG